MGFQSALHPQHAAIPGHRGNACSCPVKAGHSNFLAKKWGQNVRRTRYCHGSRPRTKGTRRLAVQAATFELAQVLAFSAFPFAAVTLLANSSLGQWLSSRLQRRREELEAELLVQEIARERARIESPWYGEGRPRFLGSLPFPYYPAYLDGTRPGDFGFDPLGLARKPEALERLFNLEVLHARWAMLGAVGALTPELLQKEGLAEFLDPIWWSVGYAKLQGDDLDYLGIPGLHVAGGQGVAIIALAQLLLMLGPEYARYTGIKALEPLGIFLPGDINYPGGWLFDPLGLSRNAPLLEDLKVREMKNGRLAMVAWVGFAVQAALFGDGPVGDWEAFLEDPERNNALAYVLGDLRGYPDYVALKAAVGDAVAAIQQSEEYRDVAVAATGVLSAVLASPGWAELKAYVVQAAVAAGSLAANAGDAFALVKGMAVL